MVDAVYRGNIEELLSVINYLKKYIIVFVIVLLILLSVFHFSETTIQVVPLITVTLVLLPAVYYTTVLVLKIGPCVLASYQTTEVTAMDADGGRRHDALKTPERPYPNSPTPPPSYEEATRNDLQYHQHYQHYQPSPWLPSTSSGYTGGGSGGSVVFNVEHQYRCGGDAAIWARPPQLPQQTLMETQPRPQPITATQPPAKTITVTQPPPQTITATQPLPQTPAPTQPLKTAAAITNIPSVTITMDNEHNGPMEI